MFTSKFLALGSMIHDSLYSPKVQDLLTSLTRDNLLMVRSLHRTDMTHVWLAMHKPSCQLCVVKGVDTIVANEQGSGKLMLAETSILSQLHSPFVVELLRTWEEPNKVRCLIVGALVCKANSKCEIPLLVSNLIGHL
jgi:serine/threonine protein kinase